MLVRDAMTAQVVTATPETPLADLIATMVERDVTGLPVVDDEGRLLGVVTEADLVARQAYGTDHKRHLSALADLVRGRRNRWWEKAAGTTTGEIMTAPAHTVYASEPLRAAAARMVTLGVKRLPVVDDDGRLVGIVSRRDLLRLFHRSDDDIAADVSVALASPMHCPEEHGVRLSCVTGGVVYLAGWTHTAADAELVVTVLRTIPGVIDVRGGIGRRGVAQERLDVTVTTPRTGPS